MSEAEQVGRPLAQMIDLEHDEDAAALAEALAFVDDFALPSVDLGAGCWGLVDAGDGLVVEQEPKQKAKRVRDPLADARRRQRRKDEREALRQQVKDLERQLTQVRRAAFRPRSEGSDTTDGDESDHSHNRRAVAKRAALRWHKALTEEHRRRCVAEAMNAKLRSALTAQVEASRSLQKCLNQLGPANVAVERPVTESRAAAFLDAQAEQKVLSELQNTVQRLYRDANASWDPSLARCVSNEFVVKTDPVVGRYCQTGATASLGRGLADVTDLIRVGFLWTKFPLAADYVLGKVTTLKKQSNMDVAVDGGTMRLNGIGLLLWSQEAGRVVLTYCSLMFHPSGKFCFREGGWLIVQQSPEHANECTYQSRARLATELLGEAAVSLDKETTQAHSSGMRALTQKVKIKYESVQHRLLMETGREDLARLVPGVSGVGPCLVGTPVGRR